MPTLAQEANKLTNPSLSRSFIRTIKDRGARHLFAAYPMKTFEGSSYDVVMEDEQASGNSARDPYGEDIPSGGGTDRRISTPVSMLIRNAKTAELDIIGKSNYFDLRQQDMEKEAKRLARDFFQQWINGRNEDGVDGYNLLGLDHWLEEYKSDFPEQQLWYTDTAEIDGSSLSLSEETFDELLSRQKGENFDVMYMNRETYVAFKSILNAKQGNMAQTVMVEKFGQRMLMYDGVPVVINDAVGIDKTFSTSTMSGSTLTVTDSEFLGFSDLNEGQAITVDGQNGTIQTYVDPYTVEVTGFTGASGAGVAETGHAIYAVRFDEVDGVCGVHHTNRGVPADATEHYGAIAGFNAKDLGLVDQAPQYWTRLDFYGQNVVEQPRALARAGGFSL